MKKRLFILLLLGIWACKKNTSNPQNKVEVFKASDKTYTQTNIYPYIQAPIKQGESSVYCASFQIAWDKLKNGFHQGSVKLEKAPKWIDFLNQHIEQPIVNDSFLVALAGRWEDGIAEKIQKELKEKFNIQTQNIEEQEKSDGITVYAFLRKKLAFYAVMDSNYVQMPFKKERVSYFGLPSYHHYTSGISLYDYRNDHDFVLELETVDKKDEVILASVSPQKTLWETYQMVKQRMSSKSPIPLEEQDEVRIPYLNFRIEKIFEGLMGKSEKNSIYYISKAMQMIDFDLNESGIILESEAVIEEDAKEEATEQAIKIPKKLYFDQPFLIILQEKGKKEPYFLMWVNNAECMRVL
jgi:hypothetical protein